MNPTLLAAEIVTALDASQQDSRLNRCDVVKGMIEREFGMRELSGIAFTARLNEWNISSDANAHTNVRLSISGSDDSMLCLVDVKIKMPGRVAKKAFGDLSYGSAFRITVAAMPSMTIHPR